MFNKWKTKFFRTKKTSKGKRSKKEGQQDFFQDFDESEKQASSRFGFAEGTAFSKKKRKEEKKAKKKVEDRIKKAQAEIDAEIIKREAKKSFRSGAGVEILKPQMFKYPSRIAVKVPKPEDTKYVTIDLKNADVLLTKTIPEGTTRKDNIKIVTETDTKPKLDEIKLLGAKVKILDSGAVVYDKVPLKGKKKGFVKATFKGFSEPSKGIRGYAAKLKRKAGKGLNIEF